MDFVKSQKYIAEHREETIKNISGFLLTDTLLFWSDKPDLFEQQKQQWQPILSLLNSVFKMNFKTTTGLSVPKNQETAATMEKYLHNISDKELTAAFLAGAETKSVLLGFLLAKQKISAEEAYAAAFLEELYQNKFWGKDVAAANSLQKSAQFLQEIERFVKDE